MPKPLISIITVNYNQAAVTCALLDSIRRQAYAEVEVIVVDNASRENPQRMLLANYPEIKYLRSERNLGFAGGNNLALREATGAYLFFINNDAELTTDCLTQLVALLRDTPGSGMVSPLICYYPAEGQVQPIVQYAGMTPVHPVTARNQTIGQGEIANGRFKNAQPTAYAHGAAMMVPREVLEKVGPMAEEFFLYYEELDWCERIRRDGYSIWVEPRARVYHKESLTVQTLGALKTYYLQRNRIYFMRRNYGDWRLWLFYAYLWAVIVPKSTILLVLKGEWANLRAFWQAVGWNFGARNNHWERQNSTPTLGASSVAEASA